MNDEISPEISPGTKSLREKLLDASTSWEVQSRTIREEASREIKRIHRNLSSEPDPTTRLMFLASSAAARAIIDTFIVSPLSVSERFAGKVRKILSPAKQPD